MLFIKEPMSEQLMIKMEELKKRITQIEIDIAELEGQIDALWNDYAKPYREQFKNWENYLSRLYGAIDAIYYGKGQYQRLFGLRKMTPVEFVAIKEKIDKQLGIADKV